MRSPRWSGERSIDEAAHSKLSSPADQPVADDAAKVLLAPSPRRLATVAPALPSEASVNWTEINSEQPRLGARGQVIPAKDTPRPIRKKKKKISADGIIDPFDP